MSSNPHRTDITPDAWPALPSADWHDAWEAFLHDDSLPPLIHAALVHAQFEAADVEILRRLVAVLDAYFERPLLWRGHREVMPAGYTVCPGAGMHRVIASLRPDGNGPESQLELALRKWADTAQRIQPNEGAALYQAMRRDGFWPISDEIGANGTPAVPGLGITAQLARSRDSAGERIYFWDGAAVRWIDR